MKNIELEKITAQLLHEIGVPASLTGYLYLQKAIITVYLDHDKINAITKELYPDIAKAFHTKANRVERAMRHAIEKAWMQGNAEFQDKVFGYTISTKTGKPTNGEFIAMLAEQLYFKVGDN